MSMQNCLLKNYVDNFEALKNNRKQKVIPYSFIILLDFKIKIQDDEVREHVSLLVRDAEEKSERLVELEEQIKAYKTSRYYLK